MDMEQSDLQPTRPSGGEGEMTVHTIEFICPHPDNPAYLILLSYSHRFNPDDPDPEFNNRAQALFNSLEINEIK